MPIHLEIEDDQVDLLREIYSAKSNELTAQMTKIQSELQKITPILIQLGLKSQKTTRTVRGDASMDYLNADYSTNLTWEQKAIYVLNKKGDLTSKQIVDLLVDEYEPKLDRAKALNSLPATIGISAGKGKLRRYKNKDDDYVYSVQDKT